MSEVKRLPLSWLNVSLADVCTVVMGQSPPSTTYNEQEIGLPFFQGKADFGDLFPTVRKWCSEPAKIAEKDDILLSVRAPVGPTNLAPSDCCIGRGLVAIRPKSPVDVRYILYALRTFQSLLQSMGTGTTFEAITGDTVRSFSIPLASSSEQRRIVEAIEQQFTRLDAGVAALKRAQAALKRYRAAVLKAAVEGKLTEAWRAAHPDEEPASSLLERILAERRAKWEADLRAKGKDPAKAKYVEPMGPDTENLPELPEGWCWATAEQVITFIRNGLSQRPESQPPGYRILRINAVRPMSVDLDEVRYLDVPSASVADYFIQNEDLLYTRYNGSVELLGVAGMVRGCTEPTLHPDKLIRVQTVPDLMLPSYLELASNTGHSRAYIESHARTTAGQTGVSGADIKQMPVPLPPEYEQALIVQEVEQRLSIVADLEASVEANLKRAERLRQSILERAFSGQLVPQDPSDEPASVLLERIRQERESGNADARKRQPRREDIEQVTMWSGSQGQ